jgi:Leucine-rich repeat (LRR) protein
MGTNFHSTTLQLSNCSLEVLPANVATLKSCTLLRASDNKLAALPPQV